MSLELLSIILNTLLASAVVFFIIWDHIKDDRILTNQVQDFYDTIEALIYTYYNFHLYKTYFSKDYILKIANKKFEKYKKMDFEGFDKKFSQRMFYLSEKVRRSIKKWGLYIGLMPNFQINEDNYDNSNLKEKILKIKYFSDTNFIITYNGEIINHLNKPVIGDLNLITENKGFEIYFFLRRLREYWKVHFRKFLLRRNLKWGINMTGLFFDYEEVRERIYNKRYDSLFRLTELLEKQIEELLKGKIKKRK